MIQVIPLTRLNGSNFALNPDLVARADTTPDTVITMTDGSRFIVSESLADVVDLIVSYRAAILRAAAVPQVEDSWARFRPSAADGEERGMETPRERDRKAAAREAQAQAPAAKRSTVVRLLPRRG